MRGLGCKTEHHIEQNHQIGDKDEIISWNIWNFETKTKSQLRRREIQADVSIKISITKVYAESKRILESLPKSHEKKGQCIEIKKERQDRNRSMWWAY